MDESERARRNALRREKYRVAGEKRKAENRAWKDAHREQVREAGRKYQKRLRTEQSERHKEAQKRWRDANKDKIKASYTRWYAQYGPAYYRIWGANKRSAEPALFMWRNARNRAAKIKVPFNLDVADIVIPSHCPVLGIALERAATGFVPCSPSIDRVRPELGYVKGNIRVISWRANELKRDGTVDEFKRIIAYMEGHFANGPP